MSEATRKSMVDRAKIWMKFGPVYLDTETTGLGGSAEICEISMVGTDGNVLLDTLVKPKLAIPSAATAIHGITNADVKGAPSFTDILPIVRHHVDGRMLVIYNAEYDTKLMYQSALAHSPIDFPPHLSVIAPSSVNCAMLLYAKFYGDWNSYHHSYRWQSLSKAAEYCKIEAPDNLHRSLADTQLTRQVLEYVVNYKDAQNVSD